MQMTPNPCITNCLTTWLKDTLNPRFQTNSLPLLNLVIPLSFCLLIISFTTLTLSHRAVWNPFLPTSYQFFLTTTPWVLSTILSLSNTSVMSRLASLPNRPPFHHLPTHQLAFLKNKGTHLTSFFQSFSSLQDTKGKKKKNQNSLNTIDNLC